MRQPWLGLSIIAACGGSFYAGCALTVSGIQDDLVPVQKAADEVTRTHAVLAAENDGMRATIARLNDANDRCENEMPKSTEPDLTTDAGRADFTKKNLARLMPNSTEADRDAFVRANTGRREPPQVIYAAQPQVSDDYPGQDYSGQ